MTTFLRSVGSLGVLLWLALGCGTLAPEPGETGPLPHGGTGVFRPLDTDETGIRGTPPGRALASRGTAYDAVSVSDQGYMFYAGARLLSDPPPPDPMLPEGDVDWAGFEPRVIYRAAQNDVFGFEGGDLVLEASEPWEGTDLETPWIVTMMDGRARLYYAAAGGIGVAEAASVDGAFTRVGSGPVLEGTGTDAPRRPSVVPAPGGDGWLMFYEIGDHIAVAESPDGLAFTTLADPVVLGEFEPRENEAEEVATGGPGAIAVTTSVGRTVIRLYHESIRADGARFVMVSGTTDGVTYDRHELPTVDEEDRRDPSPVAYDSRTTLMYMTAPREESDRQVRTPVAAITPAGVELPTGEMM